MPGKLAQRPGHFLGGEPAVLPIGHGVLGAQTIHVHRHVERPPRQAGSKLLEAILPVFAQDGVGPCAVLRRTFVGPGPYQESARAHVPVVARETVPTPSLEVAAAPDGGMFDLRQVEGAVDPASTAPLRRTDVPVRVVVEGHQGQRLPARCTSQPQATQVVEVARAVDQETCPVETVGSFLKERFDLFVSRAEAQVRSPRAQVERRQPEHRVIPRAVEVHMHTTVFQHARHHAERPRARQ